MAHAFTPYIYEGETVLWDGVVNRMVLLFFVVVYGWLLWFFSTLFSWISFWDTPDAAAALSSAKFFLWVFVVIIALLLIIRFWWLLLQRFVITDKRILLISGIIWVDVVALSYTQIKNASLDVWLVWALFGVGDVLIDSGKIHSVKVGKEMSTETKYDIFHYVSSPKDVYAHIQQQLIRST